MNPCLLRNDRANRINVYSRNIDCLTYKLKNLKAYFIDCNILFSKAHKFETLQKPMPIAPLKNVIISFGGHEFQKISKA